MFTEVPGGQGLGRLLQLPRGVGSVRCCRHSYLPAFCPLWLLFRGRVLWAGRWLGFGLYLSESPDPLTAGGTGAQGDRAPGPGRRASQQQRWDSDWPVSPTGVSVLQTFRGACGNVHL